MINLKEHSLKSKLCYAVHSWSLGYTKLSAVVVVVLHVLHSSKRFGDLSTARASSQVHMLCHASPVVTFFPFQLLQSPVTRYNCVLCVQSLLCHHLIAHLDTRTSLQISPSTVSGTLSISALST